MLIRQVTEKSAVKKPNAIYSGACATVNTDLYFLLCKGKNLSWEAAMRNAKKKKKINNNNNKKKILRETFKMELSQRHSSSAQSSDYMVCFFHAAISLHEYSIIENGRVLKYFSASTSFFCFFFQAPDLLFPHKSVKLLVEVRK